ncbi:hypothetical protein [Geomicrobium sediminis]|uniref:Uncharacterized protein n=1 Tax=Geomicrobium sediminis TaxID=1347788 RepID=A0ABS2PF79_9BACL|nr:hypothetical protein [Geomicrobium sediminis]MBM7634084.1 hypothetical protein [Geomicrobium sediminis]
MIVCRVDKVKGSTYELDPMFVDDNGRRLSVIPEAIAMGTDTYSRGDLVWVGISERDYSDAIRGKRGNGSNQAKYDPSNAVIIGRV